jgi:hypothetical protein
VSSTAYTVGNGTRVALPAQAIIDTGSTLLMLPERTVRDFYAAVPGAVYSAAESAWVHRCGAALPDLTLEASSSPSGTAAGRAPTATLALPGGLLTRGPSAKEGYPWCVGGVQETTRADMVIWGDVLLKALFVVFDGSDPPLGPRVGFALQAPAKGMDASGMAVPGGSS